MLKTLTLHAVKHHFVRDRLNELCKLCISNARPPWRLPLLCGLLGTATNAIEEVRKSEEHFFSHTVQAAPVCCLHLTDDFGSSEDAPAERFQASLQDVQQVCEQQPAWL